MQQIALSLLEGSELLTSSLVYTALVAQCLCVMRWVLTHNVERYLPGLSFANQ